MQTIDKSFYITIFFIITLLLISLQHYIFFDRDTKTKDLVNLIGINSPAFSVAWHENRLRDRALKYPAYPEMPTADRLTFVYGEEHE